jgi:16S rRNA (uracil1498-N3)-methyltransferase
MIAPDKAQSNYLLNVLRLAEGAELLVFNGRDGEWRAEVAEAGKRRGVLAVREKTAPQRIPPDLWLAFAPIRKTRTDFIVEKAAELGVARILPVFTRHTNAERLRVDRLQAHAVEAAEQCGETHVAEVTEPARLDTLLDGWDPARRLMFCDETRDALPAAEALAATSPGPWAILIGPEGGFAPDETGRLRALPYVTPVTLGPRVLRADTAAVAAITLWQSTLGDWR